MKYQILVQDITKDTYRNFSNTDSYYSTSTFTDVDNSVSFTLAARVCRTSDITNVVGVVTKGNSNESYGIYIYNNTIVAGIVDNNNLFSFVFPIVNMEIDRYYHIVLVWDANNEAMYVYLNGKYVVDESVSPTFAIKGAFYIGYNLFANTTAGTGTRIIRDVFYSNDALNEESIYRLFVNPDSANYNSFFYYRIVNETFSNIGTQSMTFTLGGSKTWIVDGVINYTPLDIEGDGGLIIEANDPLEFKFGKSSKTYTIDILNTGHNNLLLKGLFTRNKRTIDDLIFNAYLIVGELQFAGKLYINGYDIKTASAQFVCGAGTLWNSVAEKNIKEDFDWSAYNHIFNDTNINNANGLFSGAVRYDFIYRGENYSQTSSLTPMYVYDIAERQPVIQVKAIINKIFDGYTVNQNLFTTAEYNALYLMQGGTIRNSSLYQKEAVLKAKHITAGSPDFTINKYSVGNSSVNFYNFLNTVTDGKLINYTSTNSYDYFNSETGSVKGEGKIMFTLTTNSYVNTTLSNRDFTLIFERRNKTTRALINNIFISNFRADNKTYTAGVYVNETIQFSPYVLNCVDLKDDEMITISLKYSYTASVGTTLTLSVNYTANNNYLNIEPWDYFSSFSDVTGSDIVPNQTVKDFIRNLLLTFNAEFYVNIETKNIYLHNRQISNQISKNITSKIIKNSIQVELTNQVQNYKYEYSEDSNDKFAEYQIKNGQSDGSVEIESDNNKDFNVITNNYSLSYLRTSAPLIIQTVEPIPDNTFSNVVKPKYNGKHNIRFVFYNGLTSYNHYVRYMTPATYPTTTNISGTNIEFRNSIPLFTNSFGTISLNYDGVNGLYNKYHKSNTERLIEKRVISCDLILNDSDVNDLYYAGNSNDLRSEFFITVPGFDGLYQLISLNMKGDNIYRAKFINIDVIYEDNKK